MVAATDILGADELANLRSIFSAYLKSCIMTCWTRHFSTVSLGCCLQHCEYSCCLSDFQSHFLEKWFGLEVQMFLSQAVLTSQASWAGALIVSRVQYWEAAERLPALVNKTIILIYIYLPLPISSAVSSNVVGVIIPAGDIKWINKEKAYIVTAYMITSNNTQRSVYISIQK